MDLSLPCRVVGSKRAGVSLQRKRTYFFSNTWANLKTLCWLSTWRWLQWHFWPRKVFFSQYKDNIFTWAPSSTLLKTGQSPRLTFWLEKSCITQIYTSFGIFLQLYLHSFYSYIMNDCCESLCNAENSGNTSDHCLLWPSRYMYMFNCVCRPNVCFPQTFLEWLRLTTVLIHHN